MDSDHSAYRVPTGRPFLLGELYDKLPGVDDRIRELPDPADPTEYEDIADALYDVFITARNLAPHRNATGCRRHPAGPVDTEAPEGWGRCLLCNRHRRMGRPGVKAGATMPTQLWPVPDPPYTHAALNTTRQHLNTAVADLDYRSSDAEFQAVADLVHSAFVIARELSRQRNSSGCTRHPGSPIDADAPNGPQCIFCQGEERRRRLGPPNVVIRPSRPVPKYERGYRPRITPPPNQP